MENLMKKKRARTQASPVLFLVYRRSYRGHPLYFPPLNRWQPLLSVTGLNSRNPCDVVLSVTLTEANGSGFGQAR